MVKDEAVKRRIGIYFVWFFAVLGFLFVPVHTISDVGSASPKSLTYVFITYALFDTGYRIDFAWIIGEVVCIIILAQLLVKRDINR